MKRRTLVLCLSGVLATTLASAGPIGERDEPAESSALLQRVAPSPLLAIDQNRRTVIDRVVAEWGESLVRSNAGIDAGQLRSLLTAMRADQLLAASLAGSLEGLRNVVASAIVGDAAVKPSLLQAKALGDAAADLVYTPVVPCRLFDTRSSQNGLGILLPGVTRTYSATVPVAQQGGPGGCTAPAGTAVAMVQISNLFPAGVGLLQGGAHGTGPFTNALILYQPGDQYGASVPMPVLVANGQFDLVAQFSGVEVAGDLLGYFRAPQGGFVTSVTAGTGLTGGTITSSGTMAVDTAVVQSRVTGTCAAGSSMRVINANGTVTCQTDAGGAGTVTSVGTGTGLAGGPITTSGTINLAGTQLLPSVACPTNQIPKWNGSAWACAADANSGGTVTNIATGTGLTGGPITGAGTIGIANGGVGNTQLADGSVNVAKLDTASTDLRYFKQSGNALGAEAVIGTTDNFAIDVRANGARVMRYEPNAVSPNVIGGSPANNASAGVRGAAIGGGGVAAGNTDPDFAGEAPNRVTDAYGTVGGGYGNRVGNDVGTGVDTPFATVVGGYLNTAQADYSAVGGGSGNIASGTYGTVGGGESNTAGASVSFVGGGFQNNATSWGAILGGFNNSSSGVRATAAGGEDNLASGNSSVVAGGASNSATAQYATVSGGAGNQAAAFASTVLGGTSNTASGTYATVAGGQANQAQSDYSWAGGHNARALAAHPGAFVWADDGVPDFSSTAANEFSARSTGGVRFVTAVDGTGVPTAGVVLGPGDSAWSVLSDRAAKENWVNVDGREVLERLVAMPIGLWNYKAQGADIRHMGPSAQDFRAAFGLGHGDRTIATVDADGVALAAIQGLNAKLEGHASLLARQRSELEELRRNVDELRSLREAITRMAGISAVPDVDAGTIR